MHAAIAQQAANMELRPIFLDVLNRFQERRILEKRAIFNGFVHTGIVLQHALARPDILMSDLGVAHLSLRQTHRLPGGFHCRVRPLACQLIDVGCPRQRNGIALFTRIDAPTVHNDQHKRARTPGGCCTHIFSLLHLSIKNS